MVYINITKAFVEPFFLLSTFKRFQQFSVGVLDECFLTLVVLEVPQPVENLYFQPVGHQHLWYGYFEGTANPHGHTSCTLTTLHCSKVSFLQCCPMKRYNQIFTRCEEWTHFCVILYICPCVFILVQMFVIFQTL